MVTLQLIPYTEVENLTSVGRIRKLLNLTKENKIIILQGRLSKDEETELIKSTMEEINKDFKGIELAIIDPTSEKAEGVKRLKHVVVNALLGNRSGLTVLGPAGVVKEIKKDPNKIELLTGSSKSRSKRRRNP